MRLAGIASAALQALLPERCAGCGEVLAAASPNGLCLGCAAVLERNDGPRCSVCDVPGPTSQCRRCVDETPPFARVVAPFTYTGVMMTLITALKFEKREHVSRILGRLLAEIPEVATLVRGDVVLAPLPLSARRRRERGYNQSAAIARVVGRELGVRLLFPLRRRRHTQAQSDLPLAERQTNVRDAFVAQPVHGRVILVDDVVTSTESARAASLALMAAGATQVDVLAVARTPA